MQPPPGTVSVPDLPVETEAFIAQLDAAVEAHMQWTRRIVRCAVLRSMPGQDVLDPKAHTLCQFGNWFTASQGYFEAIDAPAARRVMSVHQTMHDSIRAICTRILAGEPGDAVDMDSFEQSQSELIALLARFKTMILSRAVQNDPLTGLPLRHRIENDFDLCRKDANRNRTLLYVVMIDADHFKAINDGYGHPVGDMVLRQLAHTLKCTLRSNEPLYRYGGEEFLWLLKCRSAGEAEKSAQRVLTTIASTPVRIAAGNSMMLTVTLGVAQVGQHEDLSSATRRADLALYEGKRSGRNRYVIAHEAEPSPATGSALS